MKKLIFALMLSCSALCFAQSLSLQEIEESANQGDAYAQFMLGDMYYKGEGVRQDLAKAKEYYGQACDNGDQDGCNRYKDLNQ